MEKLKLELRAKALTREQMKLLSGGRLQCYFVFIDQPECGNSAGQTIGEPCTNPDQTQCQGDAYDYCDGDPCCSDVNCS